MVLAVVFVVDDDDDLFLYALAWVVDVLCVPVARFGYESSVSSGHRFVLFLGFLSTQRDVGFFLFSYSMQPAGAS